MSPARPRSLGPLLAALLLSACSPGSAPTAEGALRDAFPAQAARVLERGEGFAPGPRGFVSRGAAPQDAWARVTAELPNDAGGEVVIRAGTLTLRVREIGGSGAAVAAGRSVVYRRPRGASFWSAEAGAVEEWIHAGPGEAASGGALAAWDVEGGAVQQRGDAVEIAGDAGAARIQVTAPTAFGVGGRPLRAWLEARGTRIALHVAPTAEAVLADPVWAVLPSMSTTRLLPSAARLADGRVLIQGGMAQGGGCVGEQRSAELFAPATNTWTLSPASTVEPHLYGFLVLLPSGKALLGGGLNCNNQSETTELYDPGSDTWSLAAPMIYYGQSVTALLPSGKLLVPGSVDFAGPAVHPTTQIYDPAQNTWSPAAPMALARSGHTATVLPDGRVLVTGGLNPAQVVVNACEIYAPATDTWSPAAPMATARNFHAATVLGDGTVLVVGGFADVAATVPLAGVEIYHPAADTWTAGPPLSVPRGPDAAIRLLDGTVLVAGGNGPGALSSAQRYDPASSAWLDVSPLPGAHGSAADVLLDDGSVLVAGGLDETLTYLSSAARFTLLFQGGHCGGPGDCASRFCVDGVCCDTACGPDPCHACAASSGATADGTCTPLSGPACTDTSHCTLTATCVAGACTAQTSLACPSLDSCHPGACDPASGVCAFPAAPNGALCDDHNACTQSDACHGGLCLGASPVICAAKDNCHDAVCEPASGACAQQKKADGAPCDDHDACTQGDTCQAGACTGAKAVVCVAPDACHAAGVCDPQTGCTHPALPTCGAAPPPPVPGLGTDGELCAADATCQSGHCARGVCCDTACAAPCGSCALPGKRGTCTPEPEGIDLNGDCGVGPNCLSTCGPGGACTGAKPGTQCLPARCIDAHAGLGPATCVAQGAPCPEAESVPFDCAAYACQAAFGACATSCRTVADCAPGHVCDATYRCGRAPDVAGGSDGCQHAPGGPGPPSGGAAAALLCALMLALPRYIRRGGRGGRRERGVDGAVSSFTGCC